jgi:hypothetical protein
MQWIDRVSSPTAFRAERVLIRAVRTPGVVATWTRQPAALALLVETANDPSVVIGGPDAIAQSIRSRMRPVVARAIGAALGELWADPRRHEGMLVLVVLSGPGGPELVAMQVALDALDPTVGRVEAPATPGPIADHATQAERNAWLDAYGSVAMRRVGTANILATARRDEVVLLGVGTGGELSYGYAARVDFRADFPEPVRLRPGESAACFALLLDMGAKGDSAPYRRFRMFTLSRPPTGVAQA